MACCSLSNRYIFVHIPKNAGTSILKALNDADPTLHLLDRNILDRHPLYREIERFFLKRRVKGFSELQDITVFMVVRNPWIRMVSLYKHRMRKLYWLDAHGKARNDSAAIACAERGFIPWLLETPHEKDKMLTRTPQLEWGRGIDGSMRAKHILRHESIQWEKMTRTLGIPFKALPRENSGSWDREAYREFYDDEAREHVAKYFEEDIKRFGYRF